MVKQAQTACGFESVSEVKRVLEKIGIVNKATLLDFMSNAGSVIGEDNLPEFLEWVLKNRGKMPDREPYSPGEREDRRHGRGRSREAERTSKRRESDRTDSDSEDSDSDSRDSDRRERRDSERRYYDRRDSERRYRDRRDRSRERRERSRWSRSPSGSSRSRSSKEYRSSRR